MLTEAQRILLFTQSILALAFSESELAALEPSLKIERVSKGTILILEGDEPRECVIPIDGEAELFSKLNGETYVSGVIKPGRSLNTFSLLRNRPYQYSARAKSDLLICRFENSILTRKIESKPHLASYLIGMTEDPDLRAIARDAQSFGCSKQFTIYFIASLQKRDYAPHKWLSSLGEVVQESLYVVEGKVVSQRASDTDSFVKQWQVPTRTWLSWRELQSANMPSTSVLKSISNAKALSISREDFETLKRLFPSDIELYSQIVLTGQESTKVTASDVEEEIDLNEVAKTPLRKRAFWKTYPWVPQSDAMDCAPACMAMISRFYDHKLGLQFWRNQLSTNRDGTSLYDLAKTAERAGFTSYALAVEEIGELDHSFFPVIALRRYHYLIVYRVTPKHVIVGDPAVGIVKMSREDFANGFEQAVLFLKPNEAFFSLPESTSQYAHYGLFLRGLAPEISLNLLVSILIVGLGLFSPVLSQIFLDDILVKRDFDLLKITLIGSAIIVLLNGFLGWTKVYYANFLATKFDFKTHSFFIKKMLSLNYKYFADRHVGDFTRRLNEMPKIKRFILESVESLVLSVLSLTIYGIALFFYSPLVAVCVFLAAPGFVLISWISGKSLSRSYQSVFRKSAELDGSFTDTIKGISTIKSSGAELASRWKYEEKFISVLKAERDFTLIGAGMGVASQFYSQFVNFSIMGLAAYMAIKGELTPGQVVAATMIAGNVLEPLTKLSSQIGQFQEVKAVCERLNDIFLAPSEQRHQKGQLRKDNLKGEIEFRDVWFRYGGESSDWVLRGVSFKIDPGTNVAFVGPSGSGKSTVAALISRMFEPTLGQIFVDGRDINDYEIDWYRSQIGVLHQESHLFQGSILENIALADPEPRMAKVFEAAHKAAADEFIQAKPSGYNYKIAAGGLGLSGGEKQRVSLARMFYREPRILVLDEATSSLDGIAEARLLSGLRTHTGDLTTINIAHRYSTVKYSEIALVLLDGKMVGFGPHDVLMLENETYRRLFSPQMTSDTGSADQPEKSDRVA